jgi:hypothetical protein
MLCVSVGFIRQTCGEPAVARDHHGVGLGLVQLRLPVMSFTRSAFLCEAYVKDSPATDQRKMGRFKTHMNLISQGRYIYRGEL